MVFSVNRYVEMSSKGIQCHGSAEAVSAMVFTFYFKCSFVILHFSIRLCRSVQSN